MHVDVDLTFTTESLVWGPVEWSKSTSRVTVDQMLISLEAPYWPLSHGNSSEQCFVDLRTLAPLIRFPYRKGLEAPYWPLASLSHDHADERCLYVGERHYPRFDFFGGSNCLLNAGSSLLDIPIRSLSTFT